jgi:hypothetical protein
MPVWLHGTLKGRERARKRAQLQKEIIETRNASEAQIGPATDWLSTPSRCLLNRSPERSSYGHNARMVWKDGPIAGRMRRVLIAWSQGIKPPDATTASLHVLRVT